MYLYLYLALCMMFILLQASDIVATIDASYDALISADCSSIDIERDDQIILPVAYGQHITVPFDTEDVFAYDSIRNMIKETKNSDDFYVLALYRSRQPDATASYIK